jgi:hypothetical protein
LLALFASDVGASTCAHDSDYLARLNSCNDKYFDALSFVCLSLVVGGSQFGSSTVHFVGSLSPIQLLNSLIVKIHKAAAFVIMFVLAWTVLDLNAHKDLVRIYFFCVNVGTAAVLCAVRRRTSDRAVGALIQRNALMAILIAITHVLLKITPPLFMQSTMSILALWQDPVFQQHVLGKAAPKETRVSEVTESDKQEELKPELRQRKSRSGKAGKADSNESANTNPQTPTDSSKRSGSGIEGDQTYKDSVNACGEAMQLMTEALKKKGWDLKDTKSGVEIYLRQEGSFTFSMGCGILPCPPHVVMHVMQDLKIKPKIAPNWRRSEKLHEFEPEALATDDDWTPYSFKVVYSELKAPFVSGRDVVGAVAQYYNPRTGGMRQVCRSVTTPKMPPTALVRSNIINSSHEVTPVEGDPNSCHMTIVAAVDPGGSIPTWVVNKLAPQNALMVNRLSKLTEVSQSNTWPPLESNKALAAIQAKTKA